MAYLKALLRIFYTLDGCTAATLVIVRFHRARKEVTMMNCSGLAVEVTHLDGMHEDLGDFNDAILRW